MYYSFILYKKEEKKVFGEGSKIFLFVLAGWRGMLASVFEWLQLAGRALVLMAGERETKQTNLHCSLQTMVKQCVVTCGIGEKTTPASKVQVSLHTV